MRGLIEKRFRNAAIRSAVSPETESPWHEQGLRLRSCSWRALRGPDNNSWSMFVGPSPVARASATRHYCNPFEGKVNRERKWMVSSTGNP